MPQEVPRKISASSNLAFPFEAPSAIPIKLGILCSHRGSNLTAIMDAIDKHKLSARVSLVICNNSQAYALKRAKNYGIPTRHISIKTNRQPDQAIVAAFKKYQVQLIVCAGYMKLIRKPLLEAWPNRILNIHPALLDKFPKFGGKGMYGMHVHRAVLKEGHTISGATVHLVTKDYDRGTILKTKSISIQAKDTPSMLQKQIQKLESSIYPAAIQSYLKKEFLPPNVSNHKAQNRPALQANCR